MGRLIDGVLALALLGTIVFSVWLESSDAAVATPGGHILGGTCHVREVTGVDCPGCGTTRSFVAFFDGDLAQAFRWHPAGPLLAFFAMIGVVAIIVAALGRRRPVWTNASFRVVLTLIGFTHLGLGVVRWFW